MYNTDSEQLFKEIVKALQSIQYGSVEIVVQDKTVTQITVRNITKTSVNIQKEEKTINQSNFSQVTSRKKIDILTMRD
ncbi:MAG: DUF2292 domain-containing protein [Candidatus Levybacteria bacterium]|nr:DUF2292 domain-containing protein [Candidatus Levybacteria bacterium]